MRPLNQRDLAVRLDEARRDLGGVVVQVLEDRLDRRVATGLGHLVPVGAVEHRRRDPDRRLGTRPRLVLVAAPGEACVVVAAGDALPAPAGGVAEVRLEDLADVHPRRHAERVQDDVDRRPVGGVRHVFDREDLRDDALVAVATSELVALGDLAALGDVDPDELVDSGWQLVLVLAGEDPHGDDLAGLAVGNLEARVAHVARLFAEDRPQEPLFGRELGLALRGHLADEDVARARPRRRCG